MRSCWPALLHVKDSLGFDGDLARLNLVLWSCRAGLVLASEVHLLLGSSESLLVLHCVAFIGQAVCWQLNS